jgi:hypothetical protein
VSGGPDVTQEAATAASTAREVRAILHVVLPALGDLSAYSFRPSTRSDFLPKPALAHHVELMAHDRVLA